MSSFILVVIIFCLCIFSDFSFYFPQIILTFTFYPMEIIFFFPFHFGISMYHITYIALRQYKKFEEIINITQQSVLLHFLAVQLLLVLLVLLLIILTGTQWQLHMFMRKCRNHCSLLVPVSSPSPYTLSHYSIRFSTMLSKAILFTLTQLLYLQSLLFCIF